MRTFVLGLLLIGGFCCCTPPVMARSVHVVTYRDGQTDIVRHDLLFRGKLEKNTVADVLKAHGMAEGVTVVTRGAP